MIFEVVDWAGTSAVANVSLNEITGTPDFVLHKMYAGSSKFARYRTSNAGGGAWDSSDESARQGNTSESTAGITALAAGQYSLAAGGDINTTGTDYFALVFHDDGNGDFAVGYYDGNNAGSRGITGIGFQPECILLFQELSPADYFKCAAHASAASSVLGGGATTTSKITALGSDGFTVDTSLNTTGKVYRWVAFKQVDDLIDSQAHSGNSTDPTDISLVGSGSPTPEFSLVKNIDASRPCPWRAEESGRGHSGDQCNHFALTSGLSSNKQQAYSANTIELSGHIDVNQSGSDYVMFWLVSNPASGGGAVTSPWHAYAGIGGAA